MARFVSKERVGINKDIKTALGRGHDGKFARLYKGNYKNSTSMKKSEKAQKFGTRKQKYRDVRASFGLSTG